MKAGCSLWLSTTMINNASLVSFHTYQLFIMDSSDKLFDELPRPLRVIRQCLQCNLFLERISLHSALARKYRSDWYRLVEPLLERNRRHEHRLSSRETHQLEAIHDRLLQIYSHPSKLFKLLQDYPCAIMPGSVSERLRDLEQRKADAMERQVRFDAENARLRAKIAKIRRQMNEMQEFVSQERWR